MDPEKTKALIEEVCQTIGGDWLLVGGSLVQLEYDAERATEDIDLVQIHHASMSEPKAQDELFKAAFRLGLGPESVNSAARFFLTEIKGWETEVVEWRRGPAGCVRRPSLNLFMALKLSRGTEIDLRDVEKALAKEGAQAFNEARFCALADKKAQARFDEIRGRLGL